MKAIVMNAGGGAGQPEKVYSLHLGDSMAPTAGRRAALTRRWFIGLLASAPGLLASAPIAGLAPWRSAVSPSSQNAVQFGPGVIIHNLMIDGRVVDSTPVIVKAGDVVTIRAWRIRVNEQEGL